MEHACSTGLIAKANSNNSFAKCIMTEVAWEAGVFVLQIHCKEKKECKEEAWGGRLTPSRTKSFAFWTHCKLWRENIIGFSTSIFRKEARWCFLAFWKCLCFIIFHSFSFFPVPSPYFFFSFRERILDFEKTRLILTKIQNWWQMLTLITYTKCSSNWNYYCYY